MTKKKHYKYMTAEEYKKIKALVEANVTAKVIMEVTGRGNFVIRTVKQTQNFEEYKALVKSHTSKYPKKEVAVETNGNGNGNGKDYPMIGAILSDMNDNIKKLVELAERAEAMKKLERKGFFGIK